MNSAKCLVRQSDELCEVPDNGIRVSQDFLGRDAIIFLIQL